MVVQQKEGRFQQQLESLIPLREQLKGASSLTEKLTLLEALPRVQAFLKQNPKLLASLQEMPPEQALPLFELLSIGQESRLIEAFLAGKLLKMGEQLAPVDLFYSSAGGLVGYHITVLQLIQGQDLSHFSGVEDLRYSKPPGFDIHEESPMTREAVLEAIRRLPEMCEIYAVGGAGDRLNLFDEKTQMALPAAKLQLNGRPLLKLLVRDLQAYEYLHFKLMGEQVTTPVAMMTSQEKDNHQHITQICVDAHWFRRPPTSFRMFQQPLVPVVTEEGDWLMEEGRLVVKPGGHGVLWKLAQVSGTFAWLKSLSRRKALVRQINNPVAATDNGLLAFIGLGWKNNKAFGFASCDRRVNAAEGMNVLVEQRAGDTSDYRVTNIEYTDFAKRGIEDKPEESGGRYSVFPANTNILFADLQTVEQLVETKPIPGTLINMKTRVKRRDGNGHEREVAVGRLESTMQNIADYIVDKNPSSLRAFVTYNHRHKTLSVVKSTLRAGASPEGTPESFLYDSLGNYRELLQQCGFDMPERGAFESYLEGRVPFMVDFHPALGPLYSITKQKIRRGAMTEGSELKLEITSVDLEGLRLDGSLCIIADAVMGHLNPEGYLVYSENTGKCTLHACRVENAGLDRSTPQNYWSGDIRRHESFLIHLEGNGEFYAKGVTFRGNVSVTVKDGEKVTATQDKNGKIHYQREALTQPSWAWKYAVDSNSTIRLTKE